METLRRLGLEKNWIYETIATTRLRDGINSAPMGVWTPDLESIKLRIHKKTRTYEGIIENPVFVVNFPNSVEGFYRSMFDNEVVRGSLFLDDCYAALEMQVSGMEDRGDFVEITARILSYQVGENPRLINRAEYLALESLIAYSKLPSASEKEGVFLGKKIHENHRVICKTAPGSVFQSLVQGLLERIQQAPPPV